MKKRKELIGKVISAKTTGTAVVAIDYLYHHPVYKKAVRRRRKVQAQVTDIKISVGDVVRLKETRPLSRTKHFMIEGKVV